jgi:orotate phosphoribosyltransferase
MSETLAARVNAVTRLEGSFRLRSGQVATHYFDKYRFEGDPVLLREVASGMLRLTPAETEVFADLELGGVPIATAMALQAELPVVFVRKQAKAYGTGKAVEGQATCGRRVLIVEDVITTGGAAADAVELLLAEGASVVGVVCAIWRGEGRAGIAGLPDIPVWPLFTDADLASA